VVNKYSRVVILSSLLLFGSVLTFANEGLAATVWPDISISGCPSKYVASTESELQTAKFDRTMLNSVIKNPNRKTLYTWLISVKSEGQLMPTFYAMAGSLGSAMKKQGRITSSDFESVASAYKEMSKGNDLLQSPMVKKRVRKLLKVYEKRSGERVDLSTMSTTGFFESKDRLVVTALIKPTAVAGTILSGWSVMTLQLVEGCLIYVNSFMGDKFHTEEDILLYAATFKVTKAADFRKGLEAVQKGDYVTALKEFTPLAEQGNADAQYNLGAMYYHGQGVSQDLKAALKWFTLAAEQGNFVHAQYNLGLMYFNGRGVSPDYKAALKWHTLAAKQGHATAQFILGVMYEKGHAAQQDMKTAIKWLTLSAKQGYAAAQSRLGFLYELGEGVRKNYKTALEWYSLAAEQGNVTAQHGLGTIYAGRRGALQDHIVAYMWLDIAVSRGFKGGSLDLELVARKMSSSDISTAQRLARECITKKYKRCGR
jgi:TPR repeat protein